MLEIAGAIGVGLGIGTLITYWFAVRPLVVRITNLRYDGFRPETPMPPRPKTVPFPSVNES